MFPSLVVGMLIVTTLANWKLLELALVSSTREIMAEELSFRMPPSWRKFYNHSVVVDLQRQGQEQRQQQASVTVDNDAGKKARKTPTSIIETTNFTKYYFLHIPKAG